MVLIRVVDSAPLAHSFVRCRTDVRPVPESATGIAAVMLPMVKRASDQRCAEINEVGNFVAIEDNNHRLSVLNTSDSQSRGVSFSKDAPLQLRLALRCVNLTDDPLAGLMRGSLVSVDVILLHSQCKAAHPEVRVSVRTGRRANNYDILRCIRADNVLTDERGYNSSRLCDCPAKSS